MKKTSIKLKDGTHSLSAPSFYALQLMSDYGVDFDGGGIGYKDISALLAAFLTDSEPLVDGEPATVWTPTMAAKVINPAELDTVLEAVNSLLSSAFPDSKGDKEPDPTNA